MNGKRLGDICDITMGQAPDGATYNEQADGLPLIAGASDLGELYPTPTRYTSQPTQVCRKGDVILCIRATIGERNWADREYCLGRGVAGLRVHPKKLDSGFLWHWLDLASTQLMHAARGATFLQVSRRDIEDLVIPAPTSLDEQRRIANILDKADSVRRKRKEAITITEELLRSTFVEMFGDPVTNPKGFPLTPLDELADITTGNTPPTHLSEYFGGEIEWIKSDNINTPGHFLTRAEKGLSAKGRAIGRIAPAGSSLVTCIAGSPECIGNVALADREVAFNQQINALTPKPDVDHRFLYMLLLVGKRLVQAASTNSMKGMVSKGRLEALLVPVPPRELRDSFGEIFDGALSVSRRADAAQQESERLFQSLLGRAFQCSSEALC